jgi:hypothetical protein
VLCAERLVHCVCVGGGGDAQEHTCETPCVCWGGQPGMKQQPHHGS